MTARETHAVVAAGLANPRLLTRWRRSPSRLRSLGIDPNALDVVALWKVAGFATKVKHNALRTDLPRTFRLLAVTGLEIEVFANYASRAAPGSHRARTLDAKTRQLVEFLEKWLDPNDPQHALLWDVLRHELTLARLGRLELSAEHDEGNGSATTRSVPCVRGKIVLHEMRFDPRIAVDLLRNRRPRLSLIPNGPFRLGYWRDRVSDDVRILELDEGAFHLLQLVDGVHSIAALSGRLGRGARPQRMMRPLRMLQRIGLLAFHGARKS